MYVCPAAAAAAFEANEKSATNLNRIGWLTPFRRVLKGQNVRFFLFLFLMWKRSSMQEISRYCL